jgi:PPOX class probable F420-dependent enzyme
MVVIDNNNSNNGKNHIQSLVNSARVARLATIDFDETKPHIVPVVFVFDGNSYYIPIDKKSKKDYDPKRLRRVRNIQANPNVALLIDEYDEDWSKLFFIMIQGKGSLIGNFTGWDDGRIVRNIESDKKSTQLHLHRQLKKSSNLRNSSGRSEDLLKIVQSLLIEKYPQYHKISMGQWCIKIWPEKVFAWKMSSSS